MSGRWRSRHWRPEDKSSNKNNNMHRGDYDEFDNRNNVHHGSEEMSYQRHHHNPQRQQQQYQQSYYDSSRYNNNYQQHNDDYGTSSMSQNNHHYHEHQPTRRTTWQRGQSLPHQSRHHNNNHHHHHDNNSRSISSSAPNNRSNSNRNNNNGTSGVNNNDDKKNDHHRATFTSAPPPVNAWGKKPSQHDDQQQQQQPSMTIKMEGSNQIASSTGGGTSNNTSAWKKKPNPTSSSSAVAAASGSSGDNNVIIKTEDDKLFPSLVSSSIKKEEDGASSLQQSHHHHHNSNNPTEHNSIQIKKEETTPVGDNAGQISTSLPSTSSWGKSHSSGWASKQQQSSSLEMAVKKKKKSSGEEFPSLSASLDAPRKQQQPLHKMEDEKGGVLMVNTKKGGGISTTTAKNNNNKNNNKKSATVANLASFLTPQLVAGGGGANEKKKDGNNKKRQPSSNNNANKSKKHPREEIHIPLLQHPATASMVNISNTNTANTAAIAGAPPLKKGRQRLAPRKKKLSTLKKRVLEERLRIWKERSGHDDETTTAAVETVVVDPSVPSASAVNTVEGNDDINKTSHHQGINQCENSTLATNNEKSATAAATTTTLLVENFVNPKEDDLTDNDEYDELVTNLISLAGRVGTVVSVYIPRPKVVDDGKEDKEEGEEEELTSSTTKEQVDDDDSTSISLLEESNHVGLSFVRLATHNDALAARDILEGMVVGGQKLCTTILYSKELQDCENDLVSSSSSSSVVVHSEENERQWRLATLKAVIANHNSSLSNNEHLSNQQDDGNDNASSHQTPESIIIFHNILSSDDYEDEDALEESIEDIKSIASQYGQVVSAYGDTSSLGGEDGSRGNVYVAYDTNDIAIFAAQKLDGMLLGGVKISVSVGSSDAANRIQLMSGLATVVLTNVLSEDDFEDEDCLNESIADIRALAEKYGVVGNVHVNNTSNKEQKGDVRIEYTGGAVVAEEAARQLNGILFGGKFISATVLSYTGSMDSSRASADPPLKKDATNDNAQQTSPQPMFSGNKVIPERFAECKRVPKVPNSGTPRAYATKIANDKAIPLLTEMLGELMRLQQRSKDDKNARSRRRLVMGLREVARGIRAHKVKMVIMANNLDEYGAIDSKLQEILDLSHSEDVPVVFELNKRKLGKAVGKSIKVSVVGIQNVSGAEQQFKQLKRMAGFT